MRFRSGPKGCPSPELRDPQPVGHFLPNGADNTPHANGAKERSHRKLFESAIRFEKIYFCKCYANDTTHNLGKSKKYASFALKSSR